MGHYKGNISNYLRMCEEMKWLIGLCKDVQILSVSVINHEKRGIQLVSIYSIYWLWVSQPQNGKANISFQSLFILEVQGLDTDSPQGY